jgi:hypothetical protein
MAQKPLVGQDLLINEASRSHSDNPNSVRLLWTRDQPDANLYLTTPNSQKAHTSMPPAGFEPSIPASDRPQTHALDRAATGIVKPVVMLETNFL